MKILYIGNKLASSGRTPTTVDTLSKQFEEFLDVVSVSDKFNKVARVWDMCSSVIKHRDADYVLIDTYSSSAFYFTLAVTFFCRVLKKKYIPILHGGNLPTRLDHCPKMSSFIFKHSYLNVSPSGYLHHEFEKRGYPRLVTIPNNIDISIYRYKERKNFSPKLLWVRSFAETYNCTMAVEVLNRLLHKYPNAELCMIGPDKDGSMQKTIDLAEQYGIKDHLKITGQMLKAKWHKLSEQYDIFISTTNFDNTPVSVIEAMALGLPVISTNVGGVPYLVNDGEDAFLVPKSDAVQMAEKVDYIINNPIATQSMCQKARTKAESFGWNKIKSQWQAILK